MEELYEINVRATLGPDDEDDKEVVILGRAVECNSRGISWQADEKQRTC